MYFLIKVKKVFIKYIEIFEKVHIIKNRFNSEFIYSTKTLKAKKKEKEKKKKKNRKGGFQFLYVSIILIEKMKTIILKCL